MHVDINSSRNKILAGKNLFKLGDYDEKTVSVNNKSKAALP